MYIIGFVLYHLLFMVTTLLLPLPYRLYSLSLCMGFFLIFLLIVPYLKLPEHHLWSYYLWTVTFLFQSLMWWMFFYYDEITYDMMYLCQAVWCTSLTFVVTGCSCFTILFGNRDWYTHLVICLLQYWLFFQLVEEPSYVLQALPITMIAILRLAEGIETAKVGLRLFMEVMTCVVILYLSYFGAVVAQYWFVLVVASLRMLCLREYRICRMYISEDQEDVIFEEWSDDALIL